ncbi:MAG: 3-phosphoshikimate 1-carboxyvinyltransferase [Chloroflexi bacterium]|nr:3-phosphoshikimate 1-carboxyvinyltransferase [Chloroflexota bacterium]
MNLVVRPVARLAGETRVSGDKSITHRALLLGALSSGTSVVSGYLDGGDCRATLGCLRGLGVRIEHALRGETPCLVVHGAGLHGWTAPAGPLNCVRSGTTMRLLAGLLAGRPFGSSLVGEAQLNRRPMGRVVAPLRAMGASIGGPEDGRYPPLEIAPARLHAIDYALPVASAQVKSCLLLAGLYADGETLLTEPGPSRDHTERMLRARGVALHSAGLQHRLAGPAFDLAALDTRVPGDLSSAAFLLVAALLAPAGEVLLRHINVNPTRIGLLDALMAMGAQITLLDARDEGGEPVADLLARPQALVGTEIAGELVPRMIDEFPILALAATQAQGTTAVRGAGELRVKETDRIAALVEILRPLGAEIEPQPDGFDVHGPTPLRGAVVDAHGDHRLAMTLAVAGLIARGETVVVGAECIPDSFPDFERCLRTLAPEALA